MKADIVIDQSGKVTFITREGTFDGGIEQVQKAMRELGVEGLEFEVKNAKDFERHTHGPKDAHILRTDHEHH